MRADMFKVIVQRPRWGGSHARAVKLKRSRTDDVSFIGHKRHVHVAADYTKILNENLAPLVRFLRSRIGRRWDDVFSEICARLDTGSTIKMHVREHLEDFVAVGISRGRFGEWIYRGEVITEGGPRIVGPYGVRYRRVRFFVDPENGLLCDGAELGRRLARPDRGRAKSRKGGAR